MKLPRRRLLYLAAGASAFAAGSRVALGQSYPRRPVHIIVGYAPGGANDIAARLLGQSLSDRLGQPFVIDNRPGGGSNIGTEEVVRASPDGYTLLLANTSNAINATLYTNLKFNFIRDIEPVAGVARAPLVMVLNPAFPAKTVPEFIAFAKANPGKVNMGSAGIGSMTQTCGELFKMMSGVDLVHVPYRGAGPALVDLLGGQVQIMFTGIPEVVEHIKAGRLRALAVTGAARSPVLPEVPSVAEFVPGYEASGWYGIGAPKTTRAEIIQRLNTEINAALVDPRLLERLAALGGTALVLSPTEFGKLIADETEKWAKVIRATGIKAG